MTLDVGAGGIQESILQRVGLRILRRDVREIAGYGMAFVASTRAVEILLSGLGVASLQVGRIHSAAVSLERVRLGLGIVDERDDRGKIVVGKILRRHPFVDTAGVHERNDFVAADIFGNQRRPGEIGSRLSAHGVAAVTKATGCGKQSLSALHEFRRVGLRRNCLRRPLRRRTVLRPSPSALATAPTTSGSGGLRRLRAEDGGNENAEEHHCTRTCSKPKRRS